MQRLRLATLLLVPFIFVGCFEIMEEIWINADGSARIIIDIGIPQSLMALGESEEGDNPFAELDEDFEKTKRDVEHNPGIKRMDFRQYTGEGLKHFVFDIEVTDLSSLNELQKIVYSGEEEPENSSNKMPLENSDLLVEKQGDRIAFIRRIGEGLTEGKSDTGSDSVGNGFEEMGKAMAGSMLGNNHYTVKLHAENIASANGAIDAEKRTVEWRIPIGELMMGNRRELRAEIVPPMDNTTAWVVGVLVAVGLAVGIVTAARKKKAKEASQA
jgi:hypothetical protein